jgi:uncharacterized membrane protein YphA (DoxX/SURF4 family)
MPKASPDNPRPIGSVHRKRVVKRHQPGGSPRLWNVVAIALGVFLTVAGVMHFANPSFFDAIVPPWLWPSERFWTYASGVAEIIVGPLVIFRRTRRVGALAAVVLLIAVFVQSRSNSFRGYVCRSSSYSSGWLGLSPRTSRIRPEADGEQIGADRHRY